jgi:PEP-CTERM motif
MSLSPSGRLLFIRLTLAASVAVAVVPPLHADPLISLAFNSPNKFGVSPIISGPDAASTAANPLFGAANVWNNVDVPFGGELTNPTWTNLVNSTGASIGVTFQVNGTVSGVDFYPFIPNLNPLRSELMGFNDNGQGQLPDISANITWSLSGLAPNATFDMCVYGSEANYNRSFNMTIGGVTHNVPTFDATKSVPPTSCVLFNNLISNSAGTITGIGTGIGPIDQFTSEGDWSGFQIVEISSSPVPEPQSLLLIGTGALALATTLRRRLLH